MNFRTTMELGGKTATGVEVPAEVAAGLGSPKRPSGLVTISGHTYRSTIATMGGRFMIPVSAEVRAATGVAAGDEVDVEVELDTEPRTVERARTPGTRARRVAKIEVAGVDDRGTGRVGLVDAEAVPLDPVIAFRVDDPGPGRTKCRGAVRGVVGSGPAANRWSVGP